MEDGSEGAVTDVTGISSGAFNDNLSTGTLISPEIDAGSPLTTSVSFVAFKTLVSCGVAASSASSAKHLAFRRHRRRLATLEGDFMLAFKEHNVLKFDRSVGCYYSIILNYATTSYFDRLFGRDDTPCAVAIASARSLGCC